MTNARVVTSAGTVLERGWIAIDDGAIVTVAQGEATAEADRVVDAGGRTALPGLIDTHRHFLPYSGATSAEELETYVEKELPPILEELLANGLTTVMSPGDHSPEIYEVRRRLRDGELRGPRLLTAGRAFTGPGGHPAEGPVCGGDPFCRSRLAVEAADPERVRAEVREEVRRGADFIKIVLDRTIVPGTRIEDAVVAAIVDEARSLGVPVIVHAIATEDVMRAVELGADALVHSPGGPLEELVAAHAAERLRERGVAVATTVAWSLRDEAELARRLANIRYLLDGGVTIAFGTDDPPPLGLTKFQYEVEALEKVLSPGEILDSMTVDAARFLGIENRVGTLEPGKVADLILVDGDPLADLSALEHVALVVQAGRVVVDRR